MLKILHCGDFHLDSPFSSLSAADPARGEERRRGLCRVFSRVLRLASDEGCGAVLISGDVFDCSYICPDTVAAMSEAFAGFGGPVVISPGNHDPYTEGSVWASRSSGFPENVHIFRSEELSCFDFPELALTVWGYAFNCDRMEQSPLSGRGSLERPGRVGVLCAHADILSPISKYAPLTPRELADSGLALAALGHIHNPPEPTLYGKTLAAYCGFPEGRGFDEQGFGAVSVITFEDGRVSDIRRVCVGEHRYLCTSVNISGAGSDAEAAAAVTQAIDKLEQPGATSLSLPLTGEVPAEYLPDVRKIRGAAESAEGYSLYSLEITDGTLPLMDGGALAEDMTVRGELYRTLLPMMQNGSPEERRTAASALRIGLRALDGRPFLDEGGSN